MLLSSPAVQVPSALSADSNTDGAVLEGHGLTKVYRMGEVDVHALRGVDISLFGAELIVLLGASGSGKSTLLNLLGGLDVPTSGTLRYRNHELTHARERDLTIYRRDHVGFVFQFYNLIPSLTARENVALVTDIAEEPLDPQIALELVGLGPRQDHFPAQLSGGEQQRVAIARAIAKRPDVLLCDEPTGALDCQTGVLVLEVIDRINRELGTSGHLERIELNPGDHVQAGSVLARILPIASPLLDPRTRRTAEARLAMAAAARNQAASQIERAAARYAFAREDAARKRALEKDRALPHELLDAAELEERTAATELESLRFARQVAEHEVEMARASLGHLSGPRGMEELEIKSPVNGRILRLIQESEGVVQPGTPPGQSRQITS